VANRELSKLFLVRENPEVLITKKTQAIFAIYVTEKETRSGIREVHMPAAFVTLGEFDSRPYIGWLLTLKEFQGHGLASTLIKLCQESSNVLTLHEDATNERLKNFYLKLGFKIIGERFVPDGHGGHAKQFYMEWTKLSAGRKLKL
jgi:ribosomal protein S18 acetylase RimI-like enzyme